MERLSPENSGMDLLSSGSAPSSIIRGAAYTLLTSFAVLYLLFQKKLLPHNVAKWASKILFYPTFPITLLGRIGNYYTKVDETLFLGCAPMAIFGIPRNISNAGVKGVINMCYEYSGPEESYKEVGIRQLRIPVVDHFEPSADNLRLAVDFISEHKKRGEKVYVHCKAGHGRAAAVALAWMIHECPHKTPRDLNALLGSMRKVRKNLYSQNNIVEFSDNIKKDANK